MTAENKRVFVTGDVVIDRHLYLGKRFHPHSTERGTFLHEEYGGAYLLKKSLSELSTFLENIHFGFSGIDNNDEGICDIPEKFYSYVMWEEVDSGYELEGLPKKVWRIRELQGYGPTDESQPQEHKLTPSDEKDKKARLVLIDDADLGFRNHQKFWPKFITNKNDDDPDFLILKMSHPVCEGALWENITRNSTINKKTILIVSAGDLRKGDRRIAREQSWEKTIQDVLSEIYNLKSLPNITEIGHLVITFRYEGVLWVKLQEKTCCFIFDPSHLEGHWRESFHGKALGLHSCFTAVLAEHIWQQSQSQQDNIDLKNGIKRGLSAMRLHYLFGHGEVDNKTTTGIQYKNIKDILDNPPENLWNFGDIEFDKSRVEKHVGRKEWTFLDITLSEKDIEPSKLAFDIATKGQKALKDIPYAQFGKMITVDRTEIESLRGINSLIKNYLENGDGQKPLCIAVFGQPGSGKSFGVKALAKQIWHAKHPVEYLLEFNLSQFTDEDQLIGAFHLVRDRALKGVVPLVFWDEFDSMGLMWLRHFLSPMQDGSFLEGQTIHPIGKSVFVFAGGTSFTMDSFIPRAKEKEKYQEFVKQKGPDFVSRLHGYMNVLGPNRRKIPRCPASLDSGWMHDETDRWFPIRRALLLRALAKLGLNERLDMDEGLLRALLEINEFKHGARSIATLWTLMKNRGFGTIRRSDLPPKEQLSLHVDYDEFIKLLERRQET